MAKKKKRAAAAAAAAAAAPAPASAPSLSKALPAEVIVRAQAILDGGDPAAARELLVAHADTVQDSPDALELLALCELDLLNETAAAQCLRRAIALNPARLSPAAFMSLAQLSEGPEALRLYERGISGLQDEADVLAPDADHDPIIAEELASIRRKMALALCAMTEIYMTDCCDDPAAEQLCTEFSARAISLSPISPEPHQTRASVFLSKCDPSTATECIINSLSLWSREDTNSWPIFPTRLATAKILMEVGKLEESASILETLLKEDDEDLEVWYLFSWCYYRMGGGGNLEADGDIGMDGVEGSISIEDKVDCWIDAKECLEKLIELASKAEGECDPDMLDHSKQIMEEVTSTLSQNPDIVQRIEASHRERGIGEEFQEDNMEVV
ncbi:hypothetical protein HDU84_003054 [Entophlyctis sp. JEL0112]|nr:hypothetical protein HDU84_003054 [Entophlyctis sp. JEL0112]